MRVVVLGTSSGKPTPRRGLSSTALVRDGKMFLFDCGEGTQVQLRRAGLRMSRIQAVFISHFHGDHINGLPGLLGTLTLDRHQNPVKIVGPYGIGEYIRTLRKLKIIQPGYPLEVKEIRTGRELVLEDSRYKIEAGMLRHRIACYGFSFTEAFRPGKFDIEAARELKIPPGPLYSQLQSGNSVVLNDGTTIESAQVLGIPRPGRKFVYCTDTVPCETAVELAEGADCLIHEGTYGEDMKDESANRGHSTVAEAAQVALKAKVKKLIITHISPTYQDIGPLLDQAREIFPNTDLAHDLYQMELPLKTCKIPSE